MKEIFDLFILLIILAINLAIFLSFVGFFWGSAAGAPFVPTGKKIARKMIELAAIKPGEKVYDLGCGDGRLVFLAAAEGAAATGVEISWPVYVIAKIRQKLGGHGGKLIRGSMWQQDVSDADVIFTYLFPDMMARFELELWPTLKSGCRLITHGFELRNQTPQTKWLPPGKTRGKILVYVKS